MPQLPVLNGNTNTSVGKKAVKPLTQLIHPLWEAIALTQLPEKSTGTAENYRRGAKSNVKLRSRRLRFMFSCRKRQQDSLTW